MDDTPSFGAWLRRRRKALDLTQDALAQLVGCSVASIRKFESDEQRPSRPMAERLASHLQLPTEQHHAFVRYARGQLDAVPPALPTPTIAIPIQLPMAERTPFLRSTRAELSPDQLLVPVASMLAGRPIIPTKDLPPLVGRQIEWQALQAIWDHAIQGHAQLGVITGEAGIGKTRLAEELLMLAHQQGALTAHAHTYAAAGQLAYAPLTSWLRTPALFQHLLRLDNVDLAELTRLLPELLNERPNLMPPTPATESWQRLRMFEALARAVLVDRQPLLVVLNDLQWCDQETLDWLHFLLRYAPSAPLLVLVTVRAEDARTAALRQWWSSLEREEQVTILELNALDQAETRTLAEQLAAGALEPAQAAQLYQQTEGNPLFVVELVRAELNSGVGSAITQRAIPQSSLALPTRMQAVLQTRLAQLSAVARELVSLAATIGRAFSPALLVQASEKGEGTVIAALDELWQRRVVREQADGSYDFSHDKLREVAYAGLSLAQRRLLHRRVAQALEQSHADMLNEMSAQIAAHYAQAGLSELAIPYYRQSATFAHRLGALQEAAHQLEQGLALIRGLPASAIHIQQELEMQVELASVVMNFKGWASPEAEQAYDRALALCQYADKTAALFPIIWGLHEVYMFQAKRTQARAMAEQCMDLAQHLQDPKLIVQAHHAMWGVLSMLFPNELSQALVHINAGLGMYQAQHDHSHDLQYIGHDTCICGHQIASKSLWLLGYPQQGLQHGQQAIERGQVLGHPFSLVIGLNNTGTLHVYRREARVVADLATMALEVCNRQHFPLLLAEAQILHGWACALQGKIETGLVELHQGIAGWNALGTIFGQSYHQILVAEAYLLANQPAIALAAADQAISFARREGDLEAEAHRLRGVALLAIGAPAEQVEVSYQQALTVSRRQGTRSLELRASVSLARLWQQQGKHADAHQLLSAIYGWFTEGFDTIDLIEARILLGELSNMQSVCSIG